MNELFRRFQQLPRMTKIILTIIAVVIVVGGIVLFGSPKAVAAFVAGLAIVGLLLVGYEHMATRTQGRRLAPLEQAIRGNAASAFVTISEPARRARLDDLRKSFETGVQKFRDAGKNLYALPWYLVVGEPGSGKTEAIRHCNVGFPPGLQDQLQGAGGTLNMNWWFTNHAVLLDTAGRLMFEEVEPGATSEWQEFLKLLRRSRPNCPINGMLLVIPAESLVRDSSEAIEHKGSRIAQQLDQIQRALGVRFPVYVVVTKCDLVNGFREFFDEIADPQLQHQILGWSNPASLDAPFNPELVDQHLLTVKRRLLRRRLGLLLDPVNTDDPRAPRTPQVDALYEFPDAFMDIAPRLKRYLSMIFVAGEWSAKPLFLRGIYFTSSMREGEALDAKLAEALGVPVESLPEGKVWERDRSFFLRDLFMGKVFREKGLVTRAVNTGKQQAARRGLLFGVSAAGLALLGAFSFFGHRSMNQTMIGPTEFWSSLAAAARAGQEPADLATGLAPRTLPIVAPNSKGSSEFFFRASPASPDPLLASLPISEDHKTRARIHEEIKSRIEQRLPVPWVYAPIAMLGGESDRDIAHAARAGAGRALFESSVLRTLLDASRVRLKSDMVEHRPWSGATTDAFVQLLRAQILSISGKGELPAIDPLLKFSLATNDGYTTGGAAKESVDLEALSKWHFASAEGGASATAGISTFAPADLDAASAAFVDSLDTPAPDSKLAAITRLVSALSAFDAAERSLHAIEAGKSGPDWVSDWQKRFAVLGEARTKVDAAFAVLDNRSLAKAYADELTAHREARGREVQKLLDELKPVAPSESGSAPQVAARDGTPEAARLAALRKAREVIAAGKDRLASASKEQTDLVLSLARLDAACISDPGRPSFATRFAVYSRVNDRFAAAESKDPAPTDAKARLAAIESDLTNDLRIIDEEMRERLGASREAIDANTLTAAGKVVAKKAANLAAEARRAAELAKLGGDLPNSADAIAASVARLAKPAATPLPRVPMLQFSPTMLDSKFDPVAAAQVMADFASVRKALVPTAPGSSATPTSSDRFRAADQAATEYLSRYLAHWSSNLSEHVKVGGPFTYSQLHSDLTSAGQATAILDGLGTVQALAQDAIDRIATTIDPSDRALAPKLDVAKRSLAKSRSALDSPEFRQLCSGVFSRWKSLPDNSEQARTAIAATAAAPAPLEPYYIRAADDDFVRRTWQGLTVAWMRSLAANAAATSGQPASAGLAELKALDRFPLNRFETTAKPLTSADLAAARAAVSKAPASAPSQASPACDRPISDDAAINDAARALLGCGASTSGPAADPASVARMRKMLDAIPADPAKVVCRVSILTDRPPRAGAKPVTSLPSIRMLVAEGGAAGGPPRGKTVPIRAGESLGNISLTAESVLFELRSGPNGETSAGPPFTVSGPWIPLRVIDQYAGSPVGGDLKTWDVEVTFPSGGTTYSMWLRLSFDQPLPAAPWYR